MKIVLIGFMGSGKSTIGQYIAQHLQMRLYETDRMIVTISQKESIPQIFAELGEIRFREWELEVSAQLRSVATGVIATGGGMVQNKLCIDYLATSGACIVYLRGTFELLRKRAIMDGIQGRPLFTDESKARILYALRDPLYSAYAHHIIDIDGQTIDAIGHEVIQKAMQNAK